MSFFTSGFNNWCLYCILNGYEMNSKFQCHLRFCHRSDGRYGFERNIFNCTVSYTALPMKTDLHFQLTLSKLQNFKQTSIQLFFVSPQIVQNVVTLTHFFSTCTTRWQHVKIHKYLCICLLLIRIKGKLVLLLDKTGYVLQKTRPKFIDSQNFYFHFH